MGELRALDVGVDFFRNHRLASEVAKAVISDRLGSLHHPTFALPMLLAIPDLDS
jgi:hypothetical protein